MQKKKKKKKKIKFHILRFCPTFDMLYLNVYLVQKCKKKNKKNKRNLFWVPTQFDWTTRSRSRLHAIANSNAFTNKQTEMNNNFAVAHPYHAGSCSKFWFNSV